MSIKKCPLCDSRIKVGLWFYFSFTRYWSVWIRLFRISPTLLKMNSWVSLLLFIVHCLDLMFVVIPIERSLTTQFVAVIVGPLWQTFATSLRVWSSIEGTEDAFEGIYDSDGVEISLESFVIQVVITHYLMELLYKILIFSKVRTDCLFSLHFQLCQLYSLLLWCYLCLEHWRSYCSRYRYILCGF